MDIVLRIHLVALLIGTACALPAHGEERLLSFVFGPASADAARQGARAAAGASRRWLHTPGSGVEIRKAGNPEAASIDLRIPAKSFDQAFFDASQQARDSDPNSFLTALDAAVQAAALHPGSRLVVAILNSPSWSTEAEHTLEHLTDLSRAGGVRITVLDIAGATPGSGNAAFETVTKKTGGSWLRDAKALESSIEMTAPPVEPEPKQPETAAAPEASSPADGMQFRIPVHTRFIRTSSTGTPTTGAGATMLGGNQDQSGVMMSERAHESNDATGPMRGLIMVESSLGALKFEVDDNANTFLARARIISKVVNEKGRTVWSGQKEVNIRGPLRKLDARKKGGLYFMREITLPAGERYTLEASVEDLLAGTSGSVRTPLRTGRGAPGLMASDALFVHPLSTSSDRIEADSVFSYDGEALCPNLNPVFQADEPVNLQLYFVLYPDTYGSQPDLSVELLRDGKVVGRVPIQFKNQVFDQSKDGKSSSISGKGSSIVGGKTHEFPYLANIKGARLGPGNYEAVVSIRQGRSVITRNVAFRVVGGNSLATVSAESKPGLATRPEADEPETVLPDIEPATIDSSGLAMPADEQKRLWDEAATSALGYSTHLPNFRCTQETHRFTAPAKTPDLLKEADSFKDELTYEDGKESYQTLEINGAKADKSRSDLKGVHSRGEFGTMLHGLFEPESGTRYKWAGRAMAMGVLCQVFDLQVAQNKSNFSLTHNGRREQVGYTGRLFIEEETGLVRRLTIQGDGLPKDFALQSPSLSLDYGMVRIGAQDYLLPLRSVLQLRQLKIFVRNETVFANYRKFEASSEIKYNNK